MTIEAFLRDYPYMDDEVRKLRQELTMALVEKQECYNTMKAQVITGMPHASGTDIPDPTGDAAARAITLYDERIRYYETRIQTIVDDKNLFDQVWRSDVLSRKEKDMIRFRYFEEKTWPQIAKRMNYSENHIRVKLVPAAVEKLQKALLA